MRTQAQVEAFRISRTVKSGASVEIKLDADDPRSESLTSGYDGFIRLPEGTQVAEGDYFVRENGHPAFVIPRERFEREYSVIEDGSALADGPLFPSGSVEWNFCTSPE